MIIARDYRHIRWGSYPISVESSRFANRQPQLHGEMFSREVPAVGPWMRESALRVAVPL